MQQQALDGLKWIVTILNKIDAPYRLGGGTATHLYGSGRPVNDIDISISGKYFPSILPLVREYIAIEPTHYLDKKWDCTTLSLNYHGQDIDLTDVDTLLMRHKDGTGWIKNKEIYDKYPNQTVEVDGVNITLMHPKVLLEYKEHLAGEHQEYDRRFLEEYIETHPE
jgi:hypothetical protein